MRLGILRMMVKIPIMRLIWLSSERLLMETESLEGIVLQERLSKAEKLDCDKWREEIGVIFHAGVL